MTQKDSPQKRKPDDRGLAAWLGSRVQISTHQASSPEAKLRWPYNLADAPLLHSSVQCTPTTRKRTMVIWTGPGVLETIGQKLIILAVTNTLPRGEGLPLAIPHFDTAPEDNRHPLLSRPLRLSPLVARFLALVVLVMVNSIVELMWGAWGGATIILLPIPIITATIMPSPMASCRAPCV